MSFSFRQIRGIVLPLFNFSLAVAGEITELPPVVITATRTARTVEQSLAPVTILDAEKINSVISISDALRNTPGADLTISGSAGKLTNLSLRGTNSGHVLLLVDGIPFSSVSAGTPAWEYLPLSQIDRIEIVRGPRSSLYGSAALGGIVQIFTPRGKGPNHTNLTLRAGSLDTYDARASISGSTDDSNFYLGAGRFLTTGNDIGNANQPDADGYQNNSFGVRLGQRWGKTALDFHLMRAEGHNQFDNDYTGGADQNDFRQQIAGIDLKFPLATNWHTRLSWGEARDELDYPIIAARYHTQRTYRVWQNDFTLTPNNIFTFGMDQQRDQIDSSDSYTLTSRDNDGFFLQHQAESGRHNFIAGLRYDDNQSFGGQTTGNINYGMRLTQQMQIMASWGSAFKAPTFNDLYLIVPGFYQGNPNLQPEKAHTLEIGLITTPQWGKWELRAFRTNVNNLITTTADYSTMINLERARIDGLEFSAATRFNNWDISGALTFLDPRDRTTDQNLPGRARHTAQLQFARQDGALHSELTLLNQGDRNYPSQGIYLSNYTLIGVKMNYALNRHWKIDAWVDNLLDKDYQMVANYHPAGRTLMFGVRYAGF